MHKLNEDNERIKSIYYAFENLLGGQENYRLSTLPFFIRMDMMAYGVSKNLDDYEKLTEKLPLSEVYKFILYSNFLNSI